ncbi:MAG: heme exporter protein CcmB [Chloroflexota bacterium]
MASKPRKNLQTPYLKSIWAIVRKDLAAEWRSRELFSAMFVFSLLVIFIFNFALELNINERNAITSGILWVTFTFAGTLGLNRSMLVEKDRGSLDGLLLAPIDRSAIYFGKTIGNLIFMLIVEIIVLPIYSFLYNTNLFRPGLLGIILLGSIGYSIVGTLLSSMTVQTRTRDVLLPILLFPVLLPVLISAVRASSFYLQGQPTDLIWPSVNIIIAYDIIFTAIAFMVFDFIVEE